MLITVASLDMLKHVIQTKSKIVVMASALWCGPCKMVKPSYERLVLENEGTTFLIFDVDEQQEVAKFFSISCMPTFIFIKNKKILQRKECADMISVRQALKEMEQSDTGPPPSTYYLDNYAML
jgi:thioredoxin 1